MAQQSYLPSKPLATDKYYANRRGVVGKHERLVQGRCGNSRRRGNLLKPAETGDYKGVTRIAKEYMTEFKKIKDDLYD